MVKRTVVTVGPAKGGDGWNVSGGAGGPKKVDNKLDAVQLGRKLATSAPGKSQLIVKKADGKIQLEHTYPRSSDPKRYKS
jgi:hypothetical protein